MFYIIYWQPVPFDGNWDYPENAYEYIFGLLDEYGFDYKSSEVHWDEESISCKCDNGSFFMQLDKTFFGESEICLKINNENGLYFWFSDLTCDYLCGNYKFCENYFIENLSYQQPLDRDELAESHKRDYPNLNWERIKDTFIIQDIIE